jgi:hypothetical protein
VDSLVRLARSEHSPDSRTVAISDALERAQSILYDASKRLAVLNHPAWLKVLHAQEYLKAQQAALLADPEEVA